MKERDIKPEYRLLLYLSWPEEIDLVPREALGLIMGHPDWELLVSLAERHGTAPIVYARLKSVSGVPLSVLERLRRIYLAVAHKNMKIFNACSQISSAFSDAGIEVLGLKGVHLAADVYTNIAFRPMQDLDILVKKSDIPEAGRLMKGLNFVQPHAGIIDAPRFFDHHLPPYFSVDQTFLVEIHYGLFMGDFVSDSEAQSLFNRSLSISFNDSRLQVLPPEDLLVHLAFHLTYHHNFSFGVRGVTDIALSMVRYRDALDWDKIVASAGKLDISLPLLASFQKVEELFSVTTPSNILHKLKKGCSPHQLKWMEREGEQPYLVAPFSVKSNPLSRLCWVRSWRKKIKLMFSTLFPAPSLVSLQFGIKKSSPLTLLFYLYRPVQLLKTCLFTKPVDKR